ncbi:MAG: tryptophan halogenase family protein [Sandaracinaceae bacterium]
MQGKGIVIVGGGTAGWMTASYLKKALPNVERITLVESANIRTVGVGEATFSTVKLFFDFLGLRESDWMPHCSGAYKLAIRFENWTAAGGAFYHPFQRYESADGYDAAEWWLKLGRDAEPFDYACFTTPWVCDAMRSPRYLDGTVFDRNVTEYYDDGKEPPNDSIAGHRVQYPYAYHFNASELAVYLRDWATQRGVTRVVDDVVEVLKADDGSLAGVRTKDHGVLAGELFVDCTGFRGLLLNQALGEPFVGFGDSLLTDRAVAMQIPRDIERDGIRPYTTAHAHSAGWSWNIPLYGRDGVGYVYSSQFIDETEAEREFREFLGPSARDATANHIKMRIGRSRNSWVKNCVAIGLSSAFVEPLESTGIFFIQLGIEELVNHFPGQAIDPRMVASYNRTLNDCVDGVREFLTVHYLASDRVDTPFWQATKRVTPPDSLRERMERWRSHLPCARSIYQPFHGFEAYSWSTMLLGLNYRPASHRPRLDHMDATAATRMFERIRANADRLVATLPSQYEYLTHMRSSQGEPSTPA